MDNQILLDGFEELLEYIRVNRGFDFTGYKRSTMQRRIQKRMQVLSIENYLDYRNYVEEHPNEVVPLFDTILINVTSFFRDEEAWQYIKDSILPKILQSKGENDPIRVWSAGCASGQESYTLAMILAEIMGIEQYCKRVKIYATDPDEAVLEYARRARYTEKEIESVPEPYRSKYFQMENHDYTFHNQLRRSVIFGRHDLNEDAPISHLDLLLCRNTLMYFNLDAQTRILNSFSFALNGTGYLFLGRAEMLLTQGRLFQPVELKYRIFSKSGRKNNIDMIIPITFNKYTIMSERDRSKKHLLRDAALQAAPVAQIVIDGIGRLALFNEQAQALFGLEHGDIDKPLKDLELSYQPVELRSLIDKAQEDNTPISKNGIERKNAKGETQLLDVAVHPLHRDGSLIGASITFNDVTHPHRLQDNLQRFAENLETAYEELQSANEELETTNEELQSSNEELETTNEELQAANEEMEMMNEELRSTNEDLGGANQSLRLRSDDLDLANSLLRLILGSLEAGITVLDRDLKILIWNLPAAEMWGVRSDEAEGSAFMNLDIGLPLHQMEDPIRKCLAGETAKQHLLMDSFNRKGRLFQCRITITPLLTQAHEKKGVILLMEEWSKSNDVDNNQSSA